MAPSRAPAALHAGLQAYYFDGGCYPKGGGHHIPDTLMRHIRRHGGVVKLGVEVDRILIESGRAIGVRLADGQEVRAGVVVSNADPGVTWGRLVEQEQLPWRLRHRIEHLHYSISTLSLFMAVDMDLRAAGLDSGNVWFSRTPDIDAVYSLAERPVLTGQEIIPGLFFNVTTLKDPSLRHDGLHTVEAITVASIDPFSRWQDTAAGAAAGRVRAAQGRPDRAHPRRGRVLRARPARAHGVPNARHAAHQRALPARDARRHLRHREDRWAISGPSASPWTPTSPGSSSAAPASIAPGINGVTHLGAAGGGGRARLHGRRAAHGARAVAAHLPIGASGGLAGRTAAQAAGAPIGGPGGGAVELTGEAPSPLIQPARRRDR